MGIIRHRVLASMDIDTILFYCLKSEYVMFYCLTNEDSRHYVLTNLLYYSWVLLDIESDLSRHTVLANI